MPWEPKMREPKIDITIHLDKWVLLAADTQHARNWLGDNFIVYGWNAGARRYLVSPIFDPTDMFEAIVVTNEQELRGTIFYEFMDIRPKINILQDDLLNKSLANLAKHERRLRPQNTFIHPHPEPEENARVTRYDLRRSWVSPDPFGDMREHDVDSLSDGSFEVATPKWLRRRR